MENQIEQEMEHETDTEVIQGFIGSLVIRIMVPQRAVQVQGVLGFGLRE